jgi:hypothetical protein
MKKQYRALKPVGHWKKGDIVGDLPQHKISQLLADGVIDVVKPEPKSKTANKEVATNG